MAPAHQLGLTTGVAGALYVALGKLASGGRTVILAAADGRPLGLFATADAPRETSVATVQALHDAGVQVV